MSESSGKSSVFKAGSSTVTLVFGILFQIFQDDDNLNDGCEETTFKNWSRACAIACFVYCGIATLLGCFVFCRGCFEANDSPSCFSKAFVFIMIALGILSSLSLFVCAIGLNVSDSSDCGQLHKLAMAFYIIYYIGFGITGVFFIVLFFIAKMEKRDSHLY